jgi:hypothetical protein
MIHYRLPVSLFIILILSKLLLNAVIQIINTLFIINYYKWYAWYIVIVISLSTTLTVVFESLPLTKGG